MRLLFSLVAGATLSVVLLAACNSTDTKGNKAGGANSGTNGKQTVTLPTGPESRTAQSASSDGVRRITTIELRDALNKGAAIVVDTRPAESYKQNHIKGSINIPVEQVASRSGELPRDKVIVTYCSWPAEHTSARAVQILKEQGIENAAALLGGTNAWMNAGFPMESGN